MPKKVVKIGGLYLPETEAIIQALAHKAKNKLQVAAKPNTTISTDAFSKEATMPVSIEKKVGTITTKEAFLAAAGNAAVSLEGSLDLPVGHPVLGTNPGTVYFVTAKLTTSKQNLVLVAMRWKGAMLSIRVAGAGLADIAENLNATGIFANHTGNGYYSAHLGQQGAIDTLQGSVASQMLYASVLAAIGGDLAAFDERAPYEFRNWKAEAKTA